MGAVDVPVLVLLAWPHIEQHRLARASEVIKFVARDDLLALPIQRAAVREHGNLGESRRSHVPKREPEQQH